VWYEIFAAVYFCGVVIFCVLRELIFMQFGQIGFSCWELIFAIFRKNPVPSIDDISFLLNTCNRNTYFSNNILRTLCKTSKFIVYRFLSERKRQVVIEQTRFLNTVFLCSEFELENIYSGANFCGKNVCGNFYLRELTFADRWTEKSQKLEPTKISCRAVVLKGQIHSRKSGKRIVLSGW